MKNNIEKMINKKKVKQQKIVLSIVKKATKKSMSWNEFKKMELANIEEIIKANKPQHYIRFLNLMDLIDLSNELIIETKIMLRKENNNENNF